MTSRLFIALEIPEEVINRIVELRDEIYGKDSSVRWEKKEKLHITLKFLGDTEEELIPQIVAELEELITECPIFDMTFSKFGLFFRNRKPRILWAGFEKNDRLHKFVEGINYRLKKFGFDVESRKFKSHVTILRVKGNEDIRKINKFSERSFPSLDFQCGRITLFKSELKPTGSVYTMIKNFEL